jgi:hypothetical protein
VVPSFPHEVAVDILREFPELVGKLLAIAWGDVPTYSELSIEDATLTEPTQFRADLVVVLRDQGKPVLAVIVEVQMSIDARKAFSWPAYAVVARSLHECPAVSIRSPNRICPRFARRRKLPAKATWTAPHSG